jgi:hypothetical protein
MSAVPKAVPSAVPSAVVTLRQSDQAIAPYKESHETADYPGANVRVLTHGEEVSPEGNRHWDTTSGTESTYSQDFAPSIPGPSTVPSRVEPMLFGGSVSESESLLPALMGHQLTYVDANDTFVQEAERLDNHGVQSTNLTGQMTSYPSPDGETYRVNNLGTQTRMQGFTMTAPAQHAFIMQQDVPMPEVRNSLPANSGGFNDSVYGLVSAGGTSNVYAVNNIPSTTTPAPAPTYAPLGWG